MDLTDAFQSIDLSSPTPPNYEEGLHQFNYIPKSPVYPPPSVLHIDEEDSPGLEDELNHSTLTQMDQGNLETESLMGSPADSTADMEHFQDVDRQQVTREKFDKELQTAPWTLQMHEKIPEEAAGIVNPVYEGHWKQSDTDILHRLNLAAQRMKNRRTDGNGLSPQDISQVKEPQSSSNQCLACPSPVEPSTEENKGSPSQEHLKNEIQKIPVEPLVKLPEIVSPIPISSIQKALHDVPVNPTPRKNPDTKKKTGPAGFKAKLVGVMTTRPKLILQRLSPVDVKVHSATI